MDLLDRLLGHDAWTTGKLLGQSRALSEEQLDLRFNLSRFTVRMTLDHIIETMELWTELMLGRPCPPRSTLPERERTLDLLQERLNAVVPQLAALAQRVRLEGRYDDTWLDPLDTPPSRTTYGGTLAHVLWHSSHHRSQLIQMLRALGVPGVIEGDVLTWEAEQAGSPSRSIQPEPLP